MKTREQVLDQILGSKAYKAAISKVSGEERKMIEEVIQDNFVNAILGLSRLNERAKSDPGLREEIAKVVKERSAIVTSKEPEKTPE